MKTRLLVTAVLATVISVCLPLKQATAQTRTARADLRIEDFQKTGNPKYKNGKLQIPFSMKIKNVGNVASQNNIVNGIRISNQYHWTGFMNSLAPNQSKTITGVLKVDPPAPSFPSRDLHLIAMADAHVAAADTSLPAWGREKESNERNNTKALGVAIPSKVGGFTTGAGAKNGNGGFGNRPGNATGVGGGGSGPVDLALEKFELRGQAKYRNGKIEIPVRIQVRNHGGLPSPSKVVNGVSFGKQYRWSGFMKSIPAGGFKVINGVVKIPDPGRLQKGRTLQLVAMTDAPIAGADTSIPKWGRVQEQNETNNKKMLKVKVPGKLDLTTAVPNQHRFGQSKLKTPRRGQQP